MKDLNKILSGNILVQTRNNILTVRQPDATTRYLADFFCEQIYEDAFSKNIYLQEELEELRLSSRSETFSPTNAYASETSLIVGSYINEVGSAVALNSPLYNISSIGIEVVFQVDATDQETVRTLLRSKASQRTTKGS